MKTTFYIALSLRTISGFDTYGHFDLGSERAAALALFDSLDGDPDPDEHSLLHIDLMETINDLPVQVKTLSCNIDQLACNCKAIAREIFRLKNLEGFSD